MKFINKLNTKNIILISLAFAVLIFGTSFFAFKNKGKNVITEATSTPVAEVEVQEEIKDGVYTNYTYGFSFEYPEEIFNKINQWQENSIKRFFVEGQRFPQLSVRMLKDHFYDEFYRKCFTADDGDVFSESEEYNSITKKRYNLGELCVSISISSKEGDYEIPQNYTVTVPSMDSKDAHISISLSGETLSETQELEDEFDSIVKSFEFIE